MNLRPQLHVKLALPFIALAALLIALPAALSGAHAQGGASLSLDADASNGSGPCSPVDENAQVAEGAEIRVAVCLTNSGEVPLAAYQFRVTYDDRIIRAPEVADAGEGLDDNPDANAGSTTFSSPDLGQGWDCSGSVGAYPEGDDDNEQNGTGVVFSGGCASVAPGGKSFTQGPLAVIRFVAQGGGETRLTPIAASVTSDDLNSVGSCEPVGDIAMDCMGATIVVSGAPVPGVTPGAVITPGTPSIGGTPVPGAQETAIAEETAAAGTPGAVNTVGAGGTASAGTPDDGTPGADGNDTRTPSRTGTPGTGTTDPSGNDDDDDSDGGGGAGMWIIVGLVVAALAIAGGGVYWVRLRGR
jgi:hypothetical protein